MGNALKSRFQDEITSIRGYVNYIENNFYNRSCSVLRTQGYEDLGILKEYVFFSDDADEKKQNARILKQIDEKIRKKIIEYESYLQDNKKVELPQINNAILDNNLKDSLCEYLESDVYDCIENPDNLSYSKLIESITPEKLKRDVDVIDALENEKYYDMLTLEDYKSILDYMHCKLYNDEVDECSVALDEYRELQILYSIFDDMNPINIYRQSFILLLTAFDAAVFDMTKIIFTNNFFDIASIVNYDKRFTINDISKHENFENFSLTIIEQILSKKYISDLLEMLYNYKEEIFDIDGENHYPAIMEIVQRRNLHVHKKGIVDEKYFTKGNGKDLMIKINDYAIIDDQYFNMAVDSLGKFVDAFPE